MKTINYIISFLIVGILLSIAACSDDIESVIPPTSEDAIFNLSYDNENPNKVYFLGEPAVDTWYTHWSFGDNTSFDEGLEPSKVYLKKGEYDVEFKIFTEGGSASSIQTVVIDSDFAGPNILRNGDFTDVDEFWTVLPISDGVEVSMENNNAQWTGGAWGQQGIYQAVHVLPNNQYQITMDIKGSGLSDSWFEVYIGTEPPIAGQDYTDGGIRIGLNTWEGCGSEPFEGPFSDVSCVGSGATFEFPTEGTVYFVIRGGGSDYGDTGVTIDNIAIRSLESTDAPIYPTLGDPVADFTSEISDLAVSFTNTSTNATSYSWDFGDNAGTSTETSPSYTYTQEGTYTVQLTASNGDESSVVSKDVTVTGAAISTSLQNGDFSDDSVWTIITQNDSGNGKLTIADGVAVFDEATDVASGSWGSEAHMGMYQAVLVEAGDYQFDMDITTNGIDEAWFDVWVGTSKPVDGVEYNADSGATKVLSFNAWDCGDTNKTYSGKMAAASCSGDGSISLEATTYYIMIRGGGFNFGEGGIVIDNVTMEDYVASIEPVADFTSEVSDLAVNFTNTSTNATSYSWDFGDNTGTSTEANPSYTYAQEGTYTVQLTANNGDESSVVTKDVTVTEAVASTSLQNGDFSDDSVWKIITQNDSGNGKLTIADGVAVFDEATDVASGSWGSEAHMGMYQGVVVEAGDYQFDMDITTNGIDEVWFEVWVGTSKPVDGVEYNADSGATKVMAFNAWDCGDTNKTYSGKMAAASCSGDGSISLNADTYYILIRGGGFNFGEGGIIIDNVTMEDYVASIEPVANFTAEITNLTASFTNGSTDATSYSWDFGDGSGTSTEVNPEYTYSEAGTYNVILTAINDSGTNEFTKEITVSAAIVDPVADFTVEISDLIATFTNTSTNATSYVWDFGDGTGSSTEETPAYTYATAGTYNVKLTATSDQGSDELIKEVTVVEATATNLVTNGTFDDATGWTINNHYEATNLNGSVTIADGVVKFDETTSTDWKHMGIYTAVELTAGTYQFEMDMTYTDISDIWGEVYIGTTQPVEGSDYNGDKKVLKAYNAWDCGDIKTYSGKATQSGCDDANPTNPGQFEITADGTYYLLFRTGGGTYGTTGIVIDNVSLVKTN